MSADLTHRVALVTGASKGIGRSIAYRLAEAGAMVAISARPSAALESTASALNASGMKVIAVPADAMDAASIAAAVSATAEAFGRIDILVNNVGGALRFGGLDDLTDADWQRAFDLNVMSMVRFVRAALPWLEKSNFPRIINISSLSGVEPGGFNPHYTTTKAATINFSKIMANALASKKILVNVVCPGPVHSEAWLENIKQTAQRMSVSEDAAAATIESDESAKVPLGRIGEGEDIAGIVTFLASDEASWITGASFHVSGGKMRSV